MMGFMNPSSMTVTGDGSKRGFLSSKLRIP